MKTRGPAGCPAGETAGGTAAVREYYERNTVRFLRWGRDGGTQNLHAALWTPATKTTAEAMQAANELVAREIEESPLPVRRLLDLGCGVGASLFYLGRRLPGIERLMGVTLSPLQVEYARRGIPAGEAERFCFAEADFLDLDPCRFACDLAFAIEAFAHALDAAAFFRTVARLLPAGGRLALIDDVLGEDGKPDRDPAARALLDTYRRSWRLPSLLPERDIVSAAAAAGMRPIRRRDLTPWLRLGRPRDRAVALLTRLAPRPLRRSLYFQMLLGGDAKQRCYRTGITAYRLLVFEVP
ncbi:MAG: methyltransferase domain-containing protein [Desulfobacterales bacterium]